MNWLNDAIYRWFGWETHEEAYARIWAEMERDHPRMTQDDLIVHNLTAIWEAEQKHKRLDGPHGEYIRGERGLQ
jgi:hypothetical protein